MRDKGKKAKKDSYFILSIFENIKDALVNFFIQFSSDGNKAMKWDESIFLAGKNGNLSSNDRFKVYKPCDLNIRFDYFISRKILARCVY